MLRPSFLSSPRQRAVGRNLALDMVAAIGVGVTVALSRPCSRRSPARRARADRARRARSRALRGQPARRLRRTLGPRSQRQLALIRGAGAGTLLVLAVVAVAPIMVAVSIVFWLSLSLGGPFHLRLWGRCTRRGSAVGSSGSSARDRAAAAAVLAALAGGLLADRSVARRRWRWPGWWVWSAPSPMPASGPERRATRAISPRATPSGPSVSGRSSRGSRWPRVLRRRPHRRRAALRHRQRRPARPVAVRRRDHRHHHRGRDDAVLPALGCRRRPTRAAGRHADRQRARAGRADRLCPGARMSRCCGCRHRGRRGQCLDRRRHRVGGQRSHAPGLEGGRDGRLERDHRRPRHRGRLHR